MQPKELFEKLFSKFDAQRWWPVTEQGELTPTYKKRQALTKQQRFEICAGAILAQNTDWKNVMKALENLNKAKMLSCKKIAGARQQTIARLIKPSGYFNQKAKKLRAFCKYLKKNYACSVEKMLAKPLAELRSELLSLHGIGNETADDIILYAAEKPVFVIDAYTHRLNERLTLSGAKNYEELQQFFESSLEKDAALFNEFHALIVRFCKGICKKKPDCEKCFLRKECAYCAGK